MAAGTEQEEAVVHILWINAGLSCDGDSVALTAAATALLIAPSAYHRISFRGGDKERSLAGEFQKKADRIRFDSPFVAQILDSVVEIYEREARWWDERDRWES
jgi:hypothetical protein